MIAAWVAAGLSVVGLLQVLVGAALVGRFVRRRGRPVVQEPVGASVLKPLHGDEPLLEAALATVCAQDYPVYQVVFGVQDAADGALPVVQRLRARFPACDIALVVDPASHGRNGKVSNLINMLPAARHDILVISDSDVHVAADWLQRLVAALEVPGAGLVTTLYTGLAAPPPPYSSAMRERRHWRPADLGALQINHYFLPGALLARALRRQDCLGATMMLRRQTLDCIGGFSALVNHLADDNVLGRLVQRLGLSVRLADTVPSTTVGEATLQALWRHELRWARTIRTLEPAPFAASALQYPLVWALLAVLLAGFTSWSLAWFAAVWLVRAAVMRATDRALELANRAPLWLLPLRELMSVAVMVASYAGRRVDWRGHEMEAEGFNPR